MMLTLNVHSTMLGDCVVAARRTIAWLLDLPTAYIHCPNNNNLALLTFFAAAGILLVFFISALNLIATQGLSLIHI